MELKYLQAMEEHGLTKKDLPEDARTGIEEIEKVMHAMGLAERNGRKITQKTFKKLAAMDKWVYYEILDMVNDTDKNEDEIPYEAEDIVEDEQMGDEDERDENQNSTQTGDSALGVKIDQELKVLYDKGKTELSWDDLKDASTTAYNVVFDNYDNTGENGLETSNFRLIETNEDVFTLTKK